MFFSCSKHSKIKLLADDLSNYKRLKYYIEATLSQMTTKNIFKPDKNYLVRAFLKKKGANIKLSPHFHFGSFMVISTLACPELRIREGDAAPLMFEITTLSKTLSMGWISWICHNQFSGCGSS